MAEQTIVRKIKYTQINQTEYLYVKFHLNEKCLQCRIENESYNGLFAKQIAGKNNLQVHILQTVKTLELSKNKKGSFNWN